MIYSSETTMLKSKLDEFLDGLSPETRKQLPTGVAKWKPASLKEKQKKKWHLLIIPSEDPPAHLTFDTCEEMFGDIREARKHGGTRIYIFNGEQAFLTKLPDDFFVHPSGNCVSFDAYSGTTEITSDGYVPDYSDEPSVEISEEEYYNELEEEEEQGSDERPLGIYPHIAGDEADIVDEEPDA